MPNLSKKALAERRRKVAHLLIEGLDIIEIAAVLGVTTATIRRDRDVIHEAWQEENVKHLDDVYNDAMSTLRVISQLALMQYRLSGGEKIDTIKKKYDVAYAPDGRELKVLKSEEHTIKNQPPDISFLNLAQKTTLDMMKIATNKAGYSAIQGYLENEEESKNNLIELIKQGLFTLDEANQVADGFVITKEDIDKFTGVNDE